MHTAHPSSQEMQLFPEVLVSGFNPGEHDKQIPYDVHETHELIALEH